MDTCWTESGIVYYRTELLMPQPDSQASSRFFNTRFLTQMTISIRSIKNAPESFVWSVVIEIECLNKSLACAWSFFLNTSGHTELQVIIFLNTRLLITVGLIRSRKFDMAIFFLNGAFKQIARPLASLAGYSIYKIEILQWHHA